MGISAPHPAVYHLFSIFRQINGGELRIPAFQRGYVWKENQVIDLLTSVREQFPIGSILLWNVNSKMLELATSEITTFPDVAESYPTNYILDGMQRLSSLYGVFHYTRGNDERLDVFYDLDSKKFYNSKDIDQEQLNTSIHMSIFSNPRGMLEEQVRLSNLSNGDALLEELLAIHAAFQDYMIPVVTIKSDDISRIVGIFERTNSTGTRLDTVDFMRAITWHQSFDLNKHLDAVRASLQDYTSGLEDETIIKCVGMLLNVAPTSEGLLSLRSSEPQALVSAFSDFLPRIDAVAAYLRQNFSIIGMDHVPYEGQILVLFKAIGMGVLEDDTQLDALTRWFWAVGFNESLRGKPDHYVVRALSDIQALIGGQIRGLEPRLKLTAQDFSDRRMIQGRALSSAFAAMFAANAAQSLAGSGVLDPVIYLADTSTLPFEPIFSKEELSHSGIESASARLFSNLIVRDIFDELMNGSTSPRDSVTALLEQEGGNEVLESQFISIEAARALAAGDVRNFLSLRSQRLHEKASQLVGN
jgi:hypothetical protein